MSNYGPIASKLLIDSIDYFSIFPKFFV